MALTANGKNSGTSRARGAKPTNSALPVIGPSKRGPSPSPGPASRTATAKITGATASTPAPARLRRRAKMILSSDRRNRVDTRARGEFSTRRSSAADIKALPSQGHKHVLETWLQHRDPQHRYVRVYQ